MIGMERRYKSWEEVQGWFDPGDAVVLGKLLSRVPIGGLMVNVGTFGGRNLAACADTIRERRLKVLAVDPWASTAQYFQTPEEWDQTYDYFKDVLKEFRIAENVTPFQMTSIDAAQVVNAKLTLQSTCGFTAALDFVFIDAEHTETALRSDILAWKPLIRPGGVIAGHDYGHPLYPGVKAAVDELLPNAQCLGDVDSSVWWCDV